MGENKALEHVRRLSITIHSQTIHTSYIMLLTFARSGWTKLVGSHFNWEPVLSIRTKQSRWFFFRQTPGNILGNTTQLNCHMWQSHMQTKEIIVAFCNTKINVFVQKTNMNSKQEKYVNYDILSNLNRNKRQSVFLLLGYGSFPPRYVEDG